MHLAHQRRSGQILSGLVDYVGRGEGGRGKVIVCIYIPCQEDKLVANF